MTHVQPGWVKVDLEDALAPLEDGRTIHQGWSPQCEKEPSESDDAWGVLKTTAIQSGAFLAEHNKRLPDKLTPRPLLEVRRGDVLITCAGPRGRCGVACLVRETRPRLMLSGKMYRFRFDDRFLDPHYAAAYLLSDTALRAHRSDEDRYQRQRCKPDAWTIPKAAVSRGTTCRAAADRGGNRGAPGSVATCGVGAWWGRMECRPPRAS